MKNLIIIINLVTISIFPQVGRQKQLADSLFASENFYQAITEYKRLQFFDLQKSFESFTNSQIAKAYKKGEFYQKSEEYFRKAIENSVSDEERNNLKIEIVKIFIIKSEKEKALSLLDSLEKSYFEKNQLDYWRGWTFLFHYDTENSLKYFNQSEIAKSIVDSLEILRKKEYSPTIAKISSAILPGFGQFYTGNITSGLISLGWNVLLGGISVNAFFSERIIEGILVTDLLWLRFYRGNIHNAEQFALEKNVKLADNLLKNLKNNYKGALP